MIAVRVAPWSCRSSSFAANVLPDRQQASPRIRQRSAVGFVSPVLKPSQVVGLGNIVVLAAPPLPGESRPSLPCLLPLGCYGFSESGYTRWANSNRIAIGSMASIGTLESAFLTYQKLRPGGLDLLCGASGGCADVLAGPYSSVFVSSCRIVRGLRC